MHFFPLAITAYSQPIILLFASFFWGDQACCFFDYSRNSREALVSRFLFGGGGGDNISYCGA